MPKKNEEIKLQIKTKDFLPKTPSLPQQISQFNPLFTTGQAMRTTHLPFSLFPCLSCLPLRPLFGFISPQNVKEKGKLTKFFSHCLHPAVLSGLTHSCGSFPLEINYLFFFNGVLFMSIYL